MRNIADVDRIASAYVGYVEKPVNLTKFGAALGAQGEPWCASFVSIVLEQTGFGHEFWSASAQQLHDQFAAKRLAGTRPRPWSIVGYHFSGEHAGINHTGIVTAVYAWGIKTIEGNTSSGVAGSQVNGGGVYRRTRSYLNVVGYGYPPYAAAPAPAPIGYWVSARTKRTGNLGLVVALARTLGDTAITDTRPDGTQVFLAYSGRLAALRISACAATKGIVCKVQATTMHHDEATMREVLATE